MDPNIKIRWTNPSNKDYAIKARALVYVYVKDRLEKTDTHVGFAIEDVYVVWFSKTLENWKALISTTLPDGMYYEVTYDGANHRTYIDAYKKFDNQVIPDDDSDQAFDTNEYAFVKTDSPPPGAYNIGGASNVTVKGNTFLQSDKE